MRKYLVTTTIYTSFFLPALFTLQKYRARQNPSHGPTFPQKKKVLKGAEENAPFYKVLKSVSIS